MPSGDQARRWSDEQPAARSRWEEIAGVIKLETGALAYLGAHSAHMKRARQAATGRSAP
jgi:hypothetical protein